MCALVGQENQQSLSVRQRTFGNNWSLDNPNVPAVAEAGFIFKGPGDLVECFACGVQVRGWEVGDDPWQRHRAATEACPIVERHFSTGSGPNGQYLIDSGYERSTESVRRGASASGSRGAEAAVPGTPWYFGSQGDTELAAVAGAFTSSGDSALNSFESALTLRSNSPEVPCQRYFSPAPVRFKKLQSRQESFQGVNWPEHLEVRPDSLVKAGFYYKGPGDRVKCGYCGGMLKNWSKSVSAIEEHLRYFPACSFVKTIEQQTATLARNIRTPARKDQCVTSEELIRRCRESRVSKPGELVNKTLRKMQYSDDQIRRARRRLRAQGVPHKVQTCMQELQRMEQEEELHGITPQDAEDVSVSDEEGEEETEEENELIAGAASMSVEELIRKLEQELRTINSESDDMQMQTTCKMCWAKPVDTLFLTCRHLTSCKDCADKVKNCPVCRDFILGTVDVFMGESHRQQTP